MQPACALVGSAQELGRHAEVTSVTVSVFPGASGAVWGVAWVVPPLYPHGPDDTAAARFAPGTLDLLRIDPEEPSDARGLARSPLAVVRAFVRPSETGFTVDSDRISRDDSGNEIVECGDLSQEMAAVDPTADDGIARNVHPGAMFFCRTAYNVVSPFVLGLRGVGTDPVPATARFFATRATQLPPTSVGFWPLPVDAPALRRSRDPSTALRDTAPEGLDVTELPGAGYAVTFRYQHHLWLGWLTPALRPLGELRPIATLGGEPGRPRIASDGARALVAFADRPAGSPDGGALPYALYAVTAPLGGDAAPAVPLVTGLAPDQDAFAPSPVALADGSWVVVFSRGALVANLVANGPADHQQVWAQHYGADLTPRGTATQISPADASDARAAAVTGGVDVAMAAGRGDTRTVVVQPIRCGPVTADGGAPPR